MACRGLPVIPAEGKRPLIDAWQRRGVPSAAELDDWLHRWPRCDYGILTGSASGLDCFDLDVDGNGWGLLTVWQRLEAIVGQIPATWAHATGNGLHVFVEHVPGARNHDLRDSHDIPVEYLTGGRQVVGPGSVHAETGRVYAEVEPVLPVAALPDPGRLIEALNRHSAPSIARTPNRPAAAPKSVLRCTAGLGGAEKLERAKRAIEKAREGFGNTTFNREAFYVSPYIAAGELERQAVERACQAAAPAWLTEREIRDTLRSALDAGIRASAPVSAVCEHPPAPSPRRSTTRAGRKPRRPLTPWEPEALIPALALISRTAAAAAWEWRSAGADRRILDVLLADAQAAGVSLEVEAPLRRLSEQTGIHTHYVRASLQRLCEHGWLVLTRQGGRTGQHSVRAPSVYQLRIPRALAVPPPHYDSPRAPVEKLSIGGSGGGFRVLERESLEVGVVPREPTCLCVAAAFELERWGQQELPGGSLEVACEDFQPPALSDPVLARKESAVEGLGAVRPATGKLSRPRRSARPIPAPAGGWEAERARQLAALAGWDPGAEPVAGLETQGRKPPGTYKPTGVPRYG